MNLEIERKFLVNQELWQQMLLPEPVHLIQGYLHRSDTHVVRLRTSGNQAWITIKGATKGITRSEFEYEIPLEDATAMIAQFALPCIEKYRYTLEVHGKCWVIDSFVTPQPGLLLAEVELIDDQEDVLLPEWVDSEVSHDPAYYNSNMI